MILFEKIAILYFEIVDLGLELLVSERGGFDVFVDYFLDLYDLLYDFLDLNWTLDVDWLHSHFLFDFASLLELLGETLYFLWKFGDGSSAFRVYFVDLFRLLLCSE